MSSKLAKIHLLGIIAISLVLGGCSIKYSFTGASIPPEAKTVSVDFFQNTAAQVNPTLSNYFTEQLKERYINQTSLNMVDELGDFAFSGQITNYTVTPVAIQGSETAAQNRLTISVHVKFVNAIDSKASFDKSFSQYEDYNSDLNFVDVEEELMRSIVTKLIDNIFNESAANW